MRFGFALSALLTLVAGGLPAQASLIVTPVFDSTISSDPSAAAIEGTIDQAISIFEATYSNNVNVRIYFQESTSGLGGSEFYYYTGSYNTFFNALVQTNANPAAIAGLTAADAGNNSVNPVTGTSDIDIKSANARAIGLYIPPGCIPTGSPGAMNCDYGTTANSVDGIVSLNTGITYPSQANNGYSYGLLSTAEHEIDEILGLGSSLPNSGSGTVNYLAGNPAPEDLFRYSAPGVFATGASGLNCASPGVAYFSYTGATNLAQFNNGCNGGDFADWQSTPLPAGVAAEVQDAFATPGAQPAYGANEIAAESSIGYTMAATTPEPATWFLLPTALLALDFRRRRAHRKP